MVDEEYFIVKILCNHFVEDEKSMVMYQIVCHFLLFLWTSITFSTTPLKPYFLESK